MRSLKGREAVLLGAAILASGCLGALEGDATTASTSLVEGATVWERGLASVAQTPPLAPTRSAAERLSELSPPGDPAFTAFDQAVELWMARYEITSAQVALMHEGKLRYQSGYGHSDQALTAPTQDSTLFRIASVTKTMTGAVVTMQVEQGLYNWSDPVFCLPPDPAPGCRLTIPLPPGRPLADARLRDITVGMLLDHTGGWGRPADKHLFGEEVVKIATTLGVPTPPPSWRYAQYMLGEKLAYEPSTNNEYCNMCYLMLGLVAESASGATLPALYEAYIFAPLDVSGDVKGGRTPVDQRDPRETYYPCESEWWSVYEPGAKGCSADVAFDLEGVLAVGGLISTAAASAAVYEVHESVFTTEAGPVRNNYHSGSLSGTATFVGTVEAPTSGEVQYAVFFNGHAPKGDPAEIIAPYELEFAIIALATAWGSAERVAGPLG